MTEEPIENSEDGRVIPSKFLDGREVKMAGFYNRMRKNMQKAEKMLQASEQNYEEMIKAMNRARESSDVEFVPTTLRAYAIEMANGVSIFTGSPFRTESGFHQLDDELSLANIDLRKGESNDQAQLPAIIEESHKVKRIISDIYSQQQNILHLDSRDFEEVVGELLRYQGFEVQLTKRTRDGGYDLIAIQQLQTRFPVKFLVECKRFADQKVGIDVIRRLMCVVQEQGATKGMIATTSYFTRVAREAQQKTYLYRLDLQDQVDILSWIRQYGEEKLMLKGIGDFAIQEG